LALVFDIVEDNQDTLPPQLAVEDLDLALNAKVCADRAWTEGCQKLIQRLVNAAPTWLICSKPVPVTTTSELSLKPPGELYGNRGLANAARANQDDAAVAAVLTQQQRSS